MSELTGGGWAAKGYLPGLYVRYKIIQPDLERMWGEQQGRCAGCQQRLAHPLLHNTELGLKFDIDHRHNEGKPCEKQDVRGMLCRPCNLFLAKIKDNETLLRNLAAYLKRHGDSLL